MGPSLLFPHPLPPQGPTSVTRRTCTGDQHAALKRCTYAAQILRLRSRASKSIEESASGQRRHSTVSRQRRRQTLHVARRCAKSVLTLHELRRTHADRTPHTLARARAAHVARCARRAEFPTPPARTRAARVAHSVHVRAPSTPRGAAPAPRALRLPSFPERGSTGGSEHRRAREGPASRICAPLFTSQKTSRASSPAGREAPGGRASTLEASATGTFAPHSLPRQALDRQQQAE